MGATVLTATKLMQKSAKCLILSRISRESKSAETSSFDQDFFWLQLLLRANIFFPNNSVSVIAWTTDWDIYRTNLHATHPTHFRLISSYWRGSRNSGHATVSPTEDLSSHELSKTTICFSTIKHVREIPDSQTTPVQGS